MKDQKQMSEEEEKKICWILHLYSTMKELQEEIEKRERSKRYFSIFVSGCITYFIVKILHTSMKMEADWVVFYGAFLCLCLHYFVDSFSRTWNRLAGSLKFKQSIKSLELERQKLDIDVPSIEEIEEEEKK